MRSYFDASDKVHMALVVDADGILLSAVTRADLDEHTPDYRLAVTIGSLGSRTIEADIPAELVPASMDVRTDRRLAVVDGRGRLIGLVCRKASRSGFCTDKGVAERRTARASIAVAPSDMASSGSVRHSV
ncbi:CBS domain-containing protein [Nocardioides immobilis]|uniref:CBS domain-containing protein n=1 Tax=Nocardioides immobilis TaxID=2049295 RepID=A0A417XZA3_9ACTN|nr:CBS domain-containing protein [Nocardioides immobilis]RHW25687.1 CBS domain-containing protein [Nocardioides immobilis]